MRGRGTRSKRGLQGALALLALGGLTLLATAASAELTQRGDLLLNFNGSISPRALPRHNPAPIAVHLDGRIRALAGDRPPGLRKISIALNRKGRLDATGLALCPPARLRSTTSAVALRICRKALIGHGSFASAITFPGAPALPAHGRLLAFNGTIHHRSVILVHLYGTDPLPVTRILFFHLSKGSGRYGTVLTASLPAVVNRWGYLSGLPSPYPGAFTTAA